jgi:Domain of unknown function (DUF1707)
MTELTPRPVPLEQTRQRVIDQLVQHYAVENLTDAALEERLTKAYQATAVAELQALVADLPVEDLRTTAVAAPGAAPAPAVARADFRPQRQVVAAVMAGTERKGVWTPPEELSVIAVMGGAELDFRQARFGPGVTEVNCFVLMGGVEIIVPPGVHVDMNGGIALMGGFSQSGTATPHPATADAPILRISGFALMGGVDVQVRHTGETGSEARRRERLERKEMKRLRGG